MDWGSSLAYATETCSRVFESGSVGETVADWSIASAVTVREKRIERAMANRLSRAVIPNIVPENRLFAFGLPRRPGQEACADGRFRRGSLVLLPLYRTR